MKLKSLFIGFLSIVWLQSALALTPRVTFEKPSRAVIRDSERWELLVVKFTEGSGIRLRNGELVSRTDADLSELDELIKLYPDVRIARLFSRSEADYDREKITGQLNTGRELANLNLYYAFGPDNRMEATRLLQDLLALDIVECAYAEPKPELPSIQTPPFLLPPSYVESQDYLEASPIGVNAYAAWNEPGGKGQNVKFIDVELAWVWTHEDLAEPFHQGGTPSTATSYRDHGTAVMGEVAGLENDFGITGIAPLTTIGGQAINIDDYPDNVGLHFDLASAALDPGDIWLIELHAVGPDGDLIAMEWWQANYDAIANSTAQGRICVEAAGNGNANFDDPVYDGRFDRNVRDSLAIIVGAGTPYAMEPEYFTCYGSRVDLNGWGSAIYTTGYGDLYASEGEDLWYTADFGGTSGASPMIVGVCCAAQSIYKELTDAVLSPEDLRAAMVETGAPQPQPVTWHIGPRPNLETLLQHEIFDVEGVFLDRSVFNCSAEVTVTVRHPEQSGSVTVTATSLNEPAGEILTLNETDPGVFRGTFTLTTSASQPGDGQISVDNGDEITVDYAPLSDSAQADTDCIPATISDISISEIGDTYVTISWTTNEPTTSQLVYGQGSPTITVGDLEMTTSHSVQITELSECTDYSFYLECHDLGDNITIADNGGAYHGFLTWERFIYLSEPLDTDPGWIISGGQWGFGQPTGSGGAHGSPDPVSGYTGDTVYGYNLSGDYASNLPEYHLTTTVIDMSDAQGSTLRFQRWLGVEQPLYDHAYIRISNDNTTWHDVWTNSAEVTDSQWTPLEYDISQWADGEPSVTIRWTMGTTDTAWEYCGWNIDDIEISSISPCSAVTPTPTPECVRDGDVNDSGDVTAGDAQLTFQIALGSYTPSPEEACAADCNGDTEVTAGDAQMVFMKALGSGSCIDD